MSEALATSGSFLFDVHTPAFRDSLAPLREEAEHPDGGFFAAGPHHELHERVLYPDEAVVLDRFTITEPDQTRVFWNWLACFTPEALDAELAAAGLRVVEVLGDVSGAPYSPNAPELALIASH